MSEWKVEIKAVSPTWEHLKIIVASIAKRFAESSSYRDAEIGASGSGGVSYSVKVESPIEERIKWLRAEADRLEKEDLRSSS